MKSLLILSIMHEKFHCLSSLQPFLNSMNCKWYRLESWVGIQCQAAARKLVMGIMLFLRAKAILRVVKNSFPYFLWGMPCPLSCLWCLSLLFIIIWLSSRINILHLLFNSSCKLLLSLTLHMTFYYSAVLWALFTRLSWVFPLLATVTSIFDLVFLDRAKSKIFLSLVFML